MEATETREQAESRLTTVDVRKSEDGREAIGLVLSPTRVVELAVVYPGLECVELDAGYDGVGLTRKEARIIGERLICFADHGTLVEPNQDSEPNGKDYTDAIEIVASLAPDGCLVIRDASGDRITLNRGQVSAILPALANYVETGRPGIPDRGDGDGA